MDSNDGSYNKTRNRQSLKVNKGLTYITFIYLANPQKKASLEDKKW